MKEEFFNTDGVEDEGEPTVASESNSLSESLPSIKPRRQVPLASAVVSLITAVAITVMSTFALTVAYINRNIAPIVGNQSTSGETSIEDETSAESGESISNVLDHLTLIDYIFREVSVNELDENFGDMVLKSYVAATGDVYAEYLTDEELDAMSSDQNGEMCGIGVTVVNGTCKVGGIDYQAIVVANVYKDSPAEKAGVLPGDCIMYVGIGDDSILVADIGYTDAINRMLGDDGTTCAFTLFRPEADGYRALEISAVRQKITKQSVYGRVYDLDQTVGVIKIFEFDNTTATQFCATVEELKSKGCTSFVLDLRGNPGGLLTSVQDMLTFFLQEGDTMISVKDNRGNEETAKLLVSSKGVVLTGSKSLTKEDVGRYRDLNFSVLVNGYSASAAELFTANMRDYGLATIVGTKTFGKGSMQSTILLSRYGCEGALKLTTAYYYPPSGVGYHGVGIQPDEGYAVELSEEVQSININLLTDEQDNQLAAAVRALQPAS